MSLLFKRKYSLAIGNAGSSEYLLYEDLEMSFRVTFNSNNKKKQDNATFEITNLGKEALNKLEKEYAKVIFNVGYEDSVRQLFVGEVVDISTRKSGTERITSLECKPASSAIQFRGVNRVIPAGSKVVDVIEEIRKVAGLKKGAVKGSRVSTSIPFGYPLSGTPQQMLDEVCETYLLEWRIQNDALYVNDEEAGLSASSILVPLITSETGLIEVPYYTTQDSTKSSKDKTKRKALQFKSLLNTEIKAGSFVKIVHDDIDGLFKVDEASFSGSFRGGEWTVDCKCSVAKEV